MSGQYQFPTPPDDLVVDVEAVKLDLRIDDSSEFDDDIAGKIRAATEEVESDCRRLFLEREGTLYLDRFPSPCAGNHGRDILVERCPVLSVEEIRYLDAAGVQQVLDEADYRVDLISEPCRISPAYGQAWPVTRMVSNAVEIDFTAGHEDPATIPDLARMAIRARAKELFEGCSGNGTGVESLKQRLKWGAEWRK